MLHYHSQYQIIKIVSLLYRRVLWNTNFNEHFNKTKYLIFFCYLKIQTKQKEFKNYESDYDTLYITLKVNLANLCESNK